jgi:hypothetical protein
VPQVTTVSFFIPRPNAIGDDPSSPTAFDELYSTSDTNSIGVSFVPGGAVISFNTGSPDAQTLYSGHVQFHWKLGAGIAPVLGVLPPGVLAGKSIGHVNRTVSLRANEVMAKGAPLAIDVDAEALSAKVFDGFPPPVEPSVNALLAQKPAVAHAVLVHRVDAQPVGPKQIVAARMALPAIHKATPRYIRATLVADPVENAQQAQLLKLYCDTYPGGKSAYLTVSTCGRLMVNPVRPLPQILAPHKQ